MTLFRLESGKHKDLPEYIYPLIVDLDVPKFAVEFGALDGLHRSNIRKLLQNGWKGLWIEPSKENFSKLQKNSEGLDVEILNMAISDTEGTSTFYYHPKHPGGSSLIHPSERKITPKHNDEYPETVECKRLITVIGDREVGFMSIDVEDMDTKILKDMLKSKIRPHVFVIEWRNEEIKELQIEMSKDEYDIMGYYQDNTIFKLKAIS